MPGKDKNIDSHQRGKRPWMITLLSILVLLASLFQLLKCSQALINWTTLESLPLSISPIYLAGTGLLWGLVGLILFWSLWTGRPWARAAGLIISLAFAAFFWIDRLWVAEPDLIRVRWPSDLAYTVAVLASIWLILNHQKSRAYFRKKMVKIP
jgi:hypothetical protein